MPPVVRIPAARIPASSVSTAAVATVVGFGGTVALVAEAGQALGADRSQIVSMDHAA